MGRPRIERFVLRALDARRAELRICVCAEPRWFVPDPNDVEAYQVEASPTFPPGIAPLTWIAVVQIDDLPQPTRGVLEVAASLYGTEEFDLSPNEDLGQMLLDLRATTWAPEPVSASCIDALFCQK